MQLDCARPAASFGRARPVRAAEQSLGRHTLRATAEPSGSRALGALLGALVLSALPAGAGAQAADSAAAAERQGIDPDLAYRLVRTESNFNPRARSRAGALGLTQLMPGTARWLEPRMTTAERIMDPDANLAVGLRYLRQLLDKYDDLRLALLAYNRGEGAVDRDLRRGRDPENGYSRHVLGTGPGRYAGDGRRRVD